VIAVWSSSYFLKSKTHFRGILDHEMLPLSVIVYKLFTYHPIIIFKRFPTDLLTALVSFVASTTLRLSGPAMELALLRNDQLYHEALHNLYQVWRTLMRSVSLFPDSVVELINTQTELLVQDFLGTVLSAPYGRRQAVSGGGQQGEEEILEENEEEEDDREVFSDLLADLGHMCLHRVERSFVTITE